MNEYHGKCLCGAVEIHAQATATSKSSSANASLSLSTSAESDPDQSMPIIDRQAFARSVDIVERAPPRLVELWHSVDYHKIGRVFEKVMAAAKSNPGAQRSLYGGRLFRRSECSAHGQLPLLRRHSRSVGLSGS